MSQQTADFSITDPLPSGTVLLEASAGTGKTWTIAALVARYVAEGHALLTEMLIITFGRAASQELRARVREQLVELERALHHPDTAGSAGSGGPLTELLLNVDDTERGLRLSRVRRALTSFDEATIATTHQFCHQVLRSLGVAGTSDASAQLVEDLDDLLVEVVDDLYLRGFVGSREEPFFTRKEALGIARAAVDDIHAQLRPAEGSAEQGSPPARRVTFAQRVRDELDRRKRRLQVMHYNDLLTQLAGALEEPDSLAAQRMRTRWRVVLVDEFQDTDPIQWEVLDRAFRGHATMVLIGDPKQAIYAFRGGDVVTYLRAEAHAQERRTLPTNYRSDAPVVEALQATLRGSALGDEQITVVPVKAHHQGSRLAGLPHPGAVRLRQVLKKEHLRGSTTIGPTRTHVSRDLALDIAELLASGATFDERATDAEGNPVPPRPLQARDVAVLAHAGRDLLTAQAELRRLGIHAVSAGGASVLRSQAAQEWLALLDAMAAPHRSMLTRAAALTNLVGRTAAELDAGGDDLDDELATTMRRLADIYAKQGAAAVLESLTIAGLPARVLAQVGGERQLTDLQHVGELLHEISQQPAGGGRLGLASLIEWLRSQMADDAPLVSGARSRRLDSDAAAVQLVTIHASKGLQYPIVYCPALFDRWVSKTPALPLFHEDGEERARCRDVGGDDPGNPGWEQSVARHKAEEAGEALRLLYVAVTRAQSQVVLWWSPTNNTGNSALHRLLFGREPDGVPAVPDSVPVPRSDADASARLEQWAARGAFTLEVANHAPVVLAPPPAEQPELAIRALDRPIDGSWRRTSYTSLSTPRDTEGHELTGGVGSEPEVAPRDDEPETPQPVSASEPALPGLAAVIPGTDVPSPMADLPVGATFGSLVHGVLEHTDPHAPDLRAELLSHIHEQLVWWPVDLDPEQLADALVAVCDSPLGPLAHGATLRDIGLSDRLRELDFEMPLGGGDVRGPVSRARLGDLAGLLREHLRPGDAVRAWADVLDAQPSLADQELRGYLTGSVDIVLRTGGSYLVVDYKTNWLGPFGDPEQPLTAADYRPEALDEAMSHSSYPLQALLYAVVAHRFLRWRLRDYSPKRHLGGVLYLYVRGMCGPQTPVIDGSPCGVFSWKPPVALVEAVSDLLDGTGEAVV
ncbi:UvrD-helicase domain-containing protein [Ornithinimicrobium faecis]|uniref:RecBCD enzyme subunit RecB n=1 Tax=Ornithinimicrobium faecis TaxID=2934158 RepID=A0ABY4YSU0_9MICO|nr:UvrD-helicase domain-containing protein [Ornithinimicrobium sp. HY1793]USQ79831.1 UvrD-helicase domain-containing protein [Ornithinimicrobium sp. HY1793]